MAIGSDSVIEFWGTQDTVSSSTSSVTDGSFSVGADTSTWTNDDDADIAIAVITWQYASGTIDTGGNIALYASLNNIQSTNDESAPSADNPHHFLGAFPVNDALGTSTDQHISILFSLEPNTKTSQEWEFYIKNNTGVTIAAGWDLYITPKAKGPHA